MGFEMGDRGKQLVLAQVIKKHRKYSAQKKQALETNYSVKENLGMGNGSFSDAKHLDDMTEGKYIYFYIYV